MTGVDIHELRGTLFTQEWEDSGRDANSDLAVGLKDALEIPGQSVRAVLNAGDVVLTQFLRDFSQYKKGLGPKPEGPQGGGPPAQAKVTGRP